MISRHYHCDLRGEREGEGGGGKKERKRKGEKKGKGWREREGGKREEGREREEKIKRESKERRGDGNCTRLGGCAEVEYRHVVTSIYCKTFSQTPNFLSMINMEKDFIDISYFWQEVHNSTCSNNVAWRQNVIKHETSPFPCVCCAATHTTPSCVVKASQNVTFPVKTV